MFPQDFCAYSLINALFVSSVSPINLVSKENIELPILLFSLVIGLDKREFFSVLPNMKKL